jgi:hypothetical protein
MPITYTPLTQGNGAISWIVEETDGEGTLISRHMVYDDPNKKSSIREIERLSPAEIATFKGLIGVAEGGGGSSTYRLTSQTLTSGSWKATGSYYTSSFTNTNITTNTRVDFTPDNASCTEVATAGILPQVTVRAGTASFYSLFPPQTNIIGEITIFPTV